MATSGILPSEAALITKRRVKRAPIPSRAPIDDDMQHELSQLFRDVFELLGGLSMSLGLNFI